jgi:hypothetical protein
MAIINLFTIISSRMPRTTPENNNHPGSATKTSKKVTIKNGSGIPTIEERLGLLDFYELFILFLFSRISTTITRIIGILSEKNCSV